MEKETYGAHLAQSKNTFDIIWYISFITSDRNVQVSKRRRIEVAWSPACHAI